MFRGVCRIDIILWFIPRLLISVFLYFWLYRSIKKNIPNIQYQKTRFTIIIVCYWLATIILTICEESIHYNNIKGVAYIILFIVFLVVYVLWDGGRKI